MKKIEKKQKKSSQRLNNSKMNLQDQTILGIDNETEIDFVVISDGKMFHANIQKETDQLTFGKLTKKSFANWLAN